MNSLCDIYDYFEPTIWCLLPFSLSLAINELNLSSYFPLSINISYASGSLICEVLLFFSALISPPSSPLRLELVGIPFIWNKGIWFVCCCFFSCGLFEILPAIEWFLLTQTLCLSNNQMNSLSLIFENQRVSFSVILKSNKEIIE